MAKLKSTKKKEILERDNFECYLCGTLLQEDDENAKDFATIDHVTPLARGGSNLDDNLKACCVRCNNFKGDMSYCEIQDVIRRLPVWPPAIESRSILRGYVQPLPEITFMGALPASQLQLLENLAVK